jgi:hypothetical protein
LGGEVPGVDHGDVVGFHFDAGQESGVGVLAVPGQLQDGPALIGLVLHRRVLEVADVELAHAAVCAHRGEDVALFGKVDVVDLLVMSDELGKNAGFLDVPDGAGGVDGTGADEVAEFGVPVEGGEGGGEVVVLASQTTTFLRLSSSDTYLLSLIFQILRQSPEVAKRSGLSPA